MINLEELIKNMRDEKGLSQNQVCELIGMSQTNYSNLERKKASYSKVLQIADALDYELFINYKPKVKSNE